MDVVNAPNVDVALQREMTEKETEQHSSFLKAPAAW